MENPEKFMKGKYWPSEEFRGKLPDICVCIFFPLMIMVK